MVVCTDLFHLRKDGGIIGRQAADSGQGPGGTGHITSLDAIPGSLRKEVHADDESEREEPLESNGNSVRAGVLPFMSAIIDNGGEKDADGDCKLIYAHDHSTDPFGGGLGLIERDYEGIGVSIPRP